MISATIMGRLTKEPEVKTTQSGTQLCNISVAVNHGKNAQGEEEVTFVDLTAFGKAIEVITKFCHKATRICAACDLKLRKYTTQQGVQGASLSGTIQRLDIIDWPDQQQAAPAPAPAPQQYSQQQAAPGYGAPTGYAQQYPQQQAPGYPAAYPQAAPAPTPAPGYPQQQYQAPTAAAPAPMPGQPQTGGWTPAGTQAGTQENLFPFGTNAAPRQ